MEDMSRLKSGVRLTAEALAKGGFKMKADFGQSRIAV